MFGSNDRPTPDRRLALAVLCAGFLMVILDTTIVSVALPTIQDDLGFAASDLAWVVNAYVVAFGGLLLLVGRVGDLLGRRRMFLAGLVVFTLASIACGLADSSGSLIAARFAQGAGGAMTSAVILGMLVTLFPEPREQARAIGAYAAVGAGGASLGLIAGGLLTEAVSWHWIFFVNAPIGVATLAIATRVLEDDRGLGLHAGADLPGALLVVAALMLGVFAIVGVEEHGATSGRTLGLGVLALVLLAGFVAREARARTPLVPLRIFRVRAISAANAVQVLMIAGFFGQQFLIALYLQRVLGFGAAGVGLGMLPIAVVIAMVSLGLAARVAARFGPRQTLLAGLALAALALAFLARTPVDGTYALDVLPALLVLGVGGGLAMPALTGLANTTQQLGSAIGLAVLATAAASRTDRLREEGDTAVAALTSGYGLGFAVAAGLVAAAGGVALATLPARVAAPTAADGRAPAASR